MSEIMFDKDEKFERTLSRIRTRWIAIFALITSGILSDLEFSCFYT